MFDNYFIYGSYCFVVCFCSYLNKFEVIRDIFEEGWFKIGDIVGKYVLRFVNIF